MRWRTVSRGGVTLSVIASRSTVIRYYGDGKQAFDSARCSSSDRGYLHNPCISALSGMQHPAVKSGPLLFPLLPLPVHALPFAVAAHDCMLQQ